MLARGVQDLDVRGERLSRLDEAPQDDGLDALLAAGFEARLLVEDRGRVPAGIAEEVLHPLPGRDPQALRLSEARDEEVRDRLPEVVEPGVAGLVLEPDDGDRAPGAFFLRDELPDEEGGERQENGRGRNPDLSWTGAGR